MDYLVIPGGLALFLYGAYIFWGGMVKRSVSTREGYRRARAYLVQEFRNPETDELIKQRALNVSGLTFQTIRFAFLGVWLLYLLYVRMHLGNDVALGAVGWAALFAVTLPRQKLLNFTSPFMFLTGFLVKRKKQRYEKELYRCMSQLRNSAIVHKEDGLTTDAVLAQITRYARHTRPFFNRLQAYFYEGRYEEGAQYFWEAIGTDTAKFFAGLLQKMDYLQPTDFISQLELYQSTIKEKRRTEAQASKEMRSNLVFAVVLGVCILILINFIGVGIVIDAMEYYRSFQI